jgi:hypothetical protein
MVVVVLACASNAPAQGLGPSVEPSSPEQGRAWKALQKEFAEVSQGEAQVRAEARRILRLLQKGDVDALVEECTMYDASAKDRKELTRKFLVENKADLMKRAKLADLDAIDFAAQLQFRSPEPEAGMPGEVAVPFGPQLAAPKPGGRHLYPERNELVLMWSGPYMPEANGPVHAKPQPGAKPGRWRFYQITKPYSLDRNVGRL